MMPKLHTIGRVAGKHGYTGEVSLHLNRNSAADHIKKGNFLFIEFDGKGVPFLTEHYRKPAGIVKLADISDSTAADSLEGRNILIETSSPDAEVADGADLHGYTVCNGAGSRVGIIASVEEYPAGPMLVVEDGEHTFLLPFVEDWILDVNTEAKQITMDFPEGLTDL
jgi:16S rRNA processing protein RimM